MDFIKFEYGHSRLKNPLIAYRSSNFCNDKWMYILAGLKGEQIEGIYLAHQLIDWFKEKFQLSFPCIIIPTFDVDGYLYQEHGIASYNDFHEGFPIINPQKKIFLFPEIIDFINLLKLYSPECCLQLNSTPKDQEPHIYFYGKEMEDIASFLGKSINYPFGPFSANKNLSGTLESFMMDFFFAPSVSIQLPNYNANKSVIHIAQIGLKALSALFLGQMY